MIYPDFPLNLTELFHWKHLIKFLGNKMQEPWSCNVHNCILNYDTEQVYVKLQVTYVKNKL